ncbi:efflux RND transporter permease subunit [Ketobacter nezhaii]|uniref:efflux RND transporter permease subunit n=1 Tax=Ketobacter sp. MCCC 1A13808 TaxID=2602738 RepID=UPI0018DD9249|nr:MMPL family transporter [Ketobacter sp. MCCC 1A13808]
MNPKKTGWKLRIEHSFEQLGQMLGKHPGRWLLGCLLIIAGMASQLGHLKQDSSIEGFLPEDSSVVKSYIDFKEIFGRDETFIITVQTDDPYTQTFATQLHALHQQLMDEVPYINSVDSLANARHTYGADDTLYVDDLLPETLPDDPAEIQKLKDYALTNENYQNFLISADSHTVALIVRLNSFAYEKDSSGELHRRYLDEADMLTAYEKLNDITTQYQGVISDEVDLTGGMPISLVLSELTRLDFIVLSGLANLIIGIVLMIIFKRASGVFLPLLIMALGVTITMSMMAILGTPIQVSTSILPAFLLAVCVGDSIHLLTIFYRYYDDGAEKIQALSNAMGHTGLAMLFTSITTAAGLLSFAMSELTMVSSLGIYGALGSIVAFALSISILPCVIALAPVKRRPVQQDENGVMLRFLGGCADFSVRYAKPIVVIGVVLLAGSLFIASQLKFSHYPMAWLPQDNPYTIAIKKYEERMGSTSSIEVVLDTGKDRGILNPGFLRAMDQIQKEVVEWDTENYKISKAIGITNIIKETNRALHDNNEEHYSIPDDPMLISQELFMVEMDEPDDLYNMVDKDYRIARLTITSTWFDGVYMQPLLDQLRTRLDTAMAPYDVSISYTGVAPIMGVTFAKMLISTAESYGLAAISITLMMVLLIGNVKLGLLSMIPSLLPIATVLAGMQLLGMRLDMLTMLIGSIAIGLTVDDNIHFMHGFRKLYEKTGDPAYAIKHTLMSTGRAMLITSIVLSLGFMVYITAQMTIMASFGVITAACIVLALVASYLVAPALMVLSNKTIHKQDVVLEDGLIVAEPILTQTQGTVNS